MTHPLWAPTRCNAAARRYMPERLIVLLLCLKALLDSMIESRVYFGFCAISLAPTLPSDSLNPVV